MHHIVKRSDCRRDHEANGSRGASSFELGAAFRRKVQARSIVLPCLAFSFSLLALLAKPFRRAVAVVRAIFGDEASGGFAISLQTL